MMARLEMTLGTRDIHVVYFHSYAIVTSTELNMVRLLRIWKQTCLAA